MTTRAARSTSLRAHRGQQLAVLGLDDASTSGGCAMWSISAPIAPCASVIADTSVTLPVVSASPTWKRTSACR